MKKLLTLFAYASATLFSIPLYAQGATPHPLEQCVGFFTEGTVLTRVLGGLLVLVSGVFILTKQNAKDWAKSVLSVLRSLVSQSK